MNRWDIINSLIEKNNYKSYLEIGYYKGWSFDQVKCHLKVATDPNPSKLDKDITMPYGERRVIALIGEFERTLENCPVEALYKMTSDEFFEQEKNCIFDIIFIDGLHAASQVEKDIRNSLKHLSPGGTIVLHDCNPPLYGHTTTGIDGCWTGNAYKAWVEFRYRYPEYTTYTIDTDWGCGVIEGNPTDDKSFLIDGLYQGQPVSELIKDWKYFDENRVALLGLISVEEFKTKLNEGITDNNLPA